VKDLGTDVFVVTYLMRKTPMQVVLPAIQPSSIVWEDRLGLDETKIVTTAGLATCSGANKRNLGQGQSLHAYTCISKSVRVCVCVCVYARAIICARVDTRVCKCTHEYGCAHECKHKYGYFE